MRIEMPAREVISARVIRVRLIMLAITIVLVAAAFAAVVLGAPDTVLGLALGLLALWCVPVGFLVVRWLWRKLTYRVGVRLFISYLLVGLVPFPLIFLLALMAGYFLVGQYGSITLAHVLEIEAARWEQAVTQAIEQAELGDCTGATGRLRRAQEEARQRSFTIEWLIADAASTTTSDGVTSVIAPAWLPATGWRGPSLVGDQAFLAVGRRTGNSTAAILLPLTLANARALTHEGWLQTRFLISASGMSEAGSDRISVRHHSSPEDKEPGDEVRVNDDVAPRDQVEAGWTSGEPGTPWWRHLIWVRPGEPFVRWQDGKTTEERRLNFMLRVSAPEAWDSFVQSPRDVGKEIVVALTITGSFFLAVYLVVVGFAVVMMFSIARSTSRLTRAVREVAKGNLEHRVPVKRRDQLGDLGLAFNAMIDAVHTMLAEVAEKQRLADEMAMAREIQQSLLPETTVEHAGLVVQAHFRPATEVGGDYFDIFRLDAGRLLVCVGDVAGHGLSTGLLMAMVKSALGTLVQEGHRGAELVERVNRLLLQQGTRQRMATLLVAEIDTIAARVELCSAGHPPAFVLRPGGAVEEILLSSLPLGTHLPAEPATSSLGFPRGSTLVLYSDGLIEAVGANGELGFAGLNDALQRGRGLAPARLLAALLSELDRHVEGRSLGDDLTLVVVGSNG